ncbi:hypothetical protein V1517DRAFT_3267 [Lipomyces orientalis]|uniref:Uncharacterized protein n=1 Tax=Lipomyces orientalis TaxID=1233043 RepID=A0ACC3TZ16_9ASCO
MASATCRRSSTSSISSGSPVCYTRSSSFSTYSAAGPLDDPLYGPPSPFSFVSPSAMSLPTSPAISRPASPRSPSNSRKTSIPRRESASASLSAFARLNLGRRPSVAERAEMTELTGLNRSEGNFDSQTSEEISRVVKQILDYSAIRTERRRRRSTSHAATDELPVGFKSGWGWRINGSDGRISRQERNESRSTSRSRARMRRNARCCCEAGSCGGELGRCGVLRCRERSLSPTSS